MSRKNRKNRTAATTAVGADRHLHSVTDDPAQQNAATTEGKVRAALAARPGSTTAELALAAGVGRSTAAKVLARWGHGGTAIRTEREGPRAPVIWTLAPSEGDTATDTDDTLAATAATPGSDRAADADEAANTTVADRAEDAATTGADTEDAVGHAVGAGDDSSADETPTVTDNNGGHAQGGGQGAEYDAPATADTEVEDPIAASDNPAKQDTAQVAAATAVTGGPEVEDDAVGATQAPADPDPGVKQRLPKGGLRGLVEDYLAEHPGQSFGPAKIGKDLGRSGGAVNNALEKLVIDGYATKTCAAPKRFAITPDAAQ